MNRDRGRAVQAAAGRVHGGGSMKKLWLGRFALLLTRQPDADELATAVQVAEKQGLHVVCRGLINANEFAFLP